MKISSPWWHCWATPFKNSPSPDIFQMRKYMSSLFKFTLVGFSVTCSWMHLSWYRLSWSFFSMWLVFVLWLMKFIRIQEQKPEKPVWLSSAVVHVDLYPKRPSHFLREFWLRSLLTWMRHGSWVFCFRKSKESASVRLQVYDRQNKEGSASGTNTRLGPWLFLSSYLF